jgi:hypothetical protein
MRVSIISRIRPWLLAGMERLWSQLAPRREAGGLGAVAVDVARSRRELVLENAVLRHQIMGCLVSRDGTAVDAAPSAPSVRRLVAPRWTGRRP